jgi:hypothetical protein
VIPKDPAYQARVRESFSRQSHMATLGAEIVFIAPGEVHLEFPFAAQFCTCGPSHCPNQLTLRHARPPALRDEPRVEGCEQGHNHHLANRRNFNRSGMQRLRRVGHH